ncbi:MAG: hypothetical protein GY711_11345 [bacterium]|nr:hypothetical protein [bacterium]
MAPKAKFPLAVIISGVDRITGPVRKMTRGVSGTLRNLSAVSKRFGGVALAGAGGALAIAKSTSKAGDEIAKTSRRLGIGVEALQEYRFAAERSGVETRTFDLAMQRMGRRVAEAAKGTGEARGALEELAIAATNADGSVRSIEQLLPEVAAKLGEMEDANARNALAMKLFDSEGVKLVQLLAEGAEGMEALRKEARTLGNVMTKEDVRAAEMFEDAQTNLMFALRGVRNTIGSSLMPELRKLADRLREFLVGNLPRIRRFAQEFAAKLPGRIEQLKEGFAALVQKLKPVIEAGQKAVEHFGGLNIVLGTLGVILVGPLIGNLVTLTGAVWKLVAAIAATGIGGWVIAIGAAVGLVATLATNWETVAKWLIRAGDAFREFIGLKSREDSTRERRGTRFVREVLDGPAGDRVRSGAPGNAKVQIDIKGAPPGTRASIKSDTGVVSELNLGVALGGGT